MAKFAFGVRTSNVTISNAAWEIRTGASGRAKLYELGLFNAAATAQSIGFGIPAARGATPTSPVDFQSEDPAELIVTGWLQSALAWTTSPTAPTNYYRRIALPASIGAGIVWTWPFGLSLAVSSSLVLFNITAGGVLDAYAVCDY